MPTPDASRTPDTAGTRDVPAQERTSSLDRHRFYVAAAPGRGEDCYRVRLTATWWGGWRAHLDYLGAHRTHGDQTIARFTRQERWYAEHQALRAAGAEHLAHDPHSTLVIWVGTQRLTGDDACPGVETIPPAATDTAGDLDEGHAPR
jgi:hypothetical protein